MPATIEIPADLLPEDGRFGCGPSKVRPAQLDALAATGTLAARHLAPAEDGRSRWSAGCAAGLGELFTLPDGYEVVLGLGGATAFWDIATFGLVRERSQHAVFGEFSSKFAASTRGRAVPRRPEHRRGRAGQRAPSSRAEAGHRRLRPAAQRDLDRRGDAGPAGRRRGRRARCCWSTRPAAPAGLPVDLAECDAYYFAPQKCFASDGGLWVALMSPAAHRAGRPDRRDGPLDPAVLRPADRDRQQPARPDLQHPGAGDDLHVRRAGRTGCSIRAA